MFASPTPEGKITYRKLRNIDHKGFERDLIDSPLLSSSASDLSVSELSDRYQSVLSSVLEAHAPLQRKTISARPSAPWYNNEIASQKTLRRKLERRWRRTKLDIDQQAYTNQCVHVQGLIINSKMKFYSKPISQAGDDQKSSSVLSAVCYIENRKCFIQFVALTVFLRTTSLIILRQRSTISGISSKSLNRCLRRRYRLSEDIALILM